MTVLRFMRDGYIYVKILLKFPDNIEMFSPYI